MNYKLILKPGVWSEIPGTEGKYVTSNYDIEEIQTGHIVAENVPGHNYEAKTLCRHLNFGGGFDGWTPSFFLTKIKVSEDTD